MITLYINFKGQAEAAITYYADVFNEKIKGIMKYKDMPASEGVTIPSEDLELVMYSELEVFGTALRISDVPTSRNLIVGDNIAISVTIKDEAEIENVYQKLVEGGVVHLPLGKTFFSDKYGLITDRFNITWHLLLEKNVM